jgi:hypothetical protein
MNWKLVVDAKGVVYLPPRPSHFLIWPTFNYLMTTSEAGLLLSYFLHALQRQNTEISKQIFPEKEYRGLCPNFYVHASVSDLYIPTIGLPFLLEEIHVDRSWDYINRSQTHECENWG